MLILKHGYHDYYDTVMSFGVDRTIVYDRLSASYVLSEAEVPKKLRDCLDTLPVGYVSDHIFYKNSYRSGLLGFCGKHYPLYDCHSVSWKVSPDYILQELTKQKDVDNYSLDAYKAFTADDDPDRNNHKKFWFGAPITYNYLAEVHDALKNQELPVDVTLNQKYAAPIYILYKIHHRHYESHYGVFTNPSLLKIGFPSILDPASCFQTIAQFISGVLVSPEPDIVQITDDKVQLISKGFDPKMSFRSASPGDKKARRLRNKARKKAKITPKEN